MNKTTRIPALFTVIFAAALLFGCARQGQSDAMGNSMDTMSEQKTESNMRSSQENKMQDSMPNMPNDPMEKSMDKTIKNEKTMQ